MNNYKDTLNLPQTKFPMKANLSKLEPKLLKIWYQDNLYQIIRKSKNGKKKFFLYDGPPYANGSIHIGHALNKILKDIILKAKSLSGFDAPFVPGWDCHGLPIEHKVEQLLKNKKEKINDNFFRQECRKYALEQIEIQKKDFIRLGIIGDWDNSYLTMNFKYEANIIRSLGKIIKNNYLYKGIKPVYWCFNCRSSLAEAEIEYHSKKSLSIDVAFKAIDSKDIFNVFKVKKIANCTIFIVIWTTMPWTIPANCAIAVNKQYNYLLVRIENKCLIIVDKLFNNLIKRMKIKKWEILGKIRGEKLKNQLFQHPLLEYNIPLIFSEHVNLDSGTGIVHIAPNYGPEDYYLSKKYNLKTITVLDENGIFVNNDYPELKNINIFQVNSLIVKMLEKKSLLLSCININHSYPYCWRHKTPVIFRATSQWFISMKKNNLRLKALNIINKVKWMPDWGLLRMKKMLQDRPDWCISRQRIWGIPIPLFINKKTKTLHPETNILIEKIAKKIEKQGIQAWWDLNQKKFLGSNYKKYEKVLDTLDVWFDSGSVHDAIMKKHPDFGNDNADLYLEGSDQHRGWFMSSLIISTAITNQAPYNQVLTHGFTVDKNGKKMSKSSFNTVHPKKIFNKIGSDVFRLWIASTDYTNEVVVSEETFNRSIDIYRRIRNTIRFLLSNLNNFDPKIDILKSNLMLSIDKWAIGKTQDTQNEIIKSYNNYKFHDVVKNIMNFCSIEMGSFYFEIIKDRQYTNKRKSLSHLSCQTTIFYIIESLVRWIMPILSFTSAEAWQFIPGKNRDKYIFTQEWFDKLFSLQDSDIMNNNFWELIKKLKNEVNIIIEKSRINKIIGNSLEAEVILYTNNDFLIKQFSLLEKELKFILLVSKVQILKNDKNSVDIKESSIKDLKIFLKKSKGAKCPRCWHHVNKKNIYKNICYRCLQNTTGIGEIRKFV